MEKHYSCPNCGESWSVPEVQEQECWECGYPNHDTEQDDTASNAGLVSELSDSKGGLTTYLRNDLPKKYNTIHSESRHSSAFEHQTSNYKPQTFD